MTHSASKADFVDEMLEKCKNREKLSFTLQNMIEQVQADDTISDEERKDCIVLARGLVDELEGK